MKEIVVISGKGGTGKTSLAASFAVLGGKDVVVADCDVDAADMHLLLEPDFADGKDFFSGQRAVLDPDRCIDCGACAAVCRFDAIGEIDGRTMIDMIACEGCGYCARVCPEGAVTNVERNVGQWYRSAIRTGSTMVHARLKIGADNSGKLVARVKNEARAQAERDGQKLVVVDGSPGIGCPVISSLSGASLAVLVTEPTVSALHDLRRVHELVEKFGIPCGCVINKADLNAVVHADLRRFLEEKDIVLLAEIPYDDQFTAAITQGRTVVEGDANLKELVRACWVKVTRLVAGDGNAGSASSANGRMP
jgi:MinD superfamily P-loop ATPase